MDQQLTDEELAIALQEFTNGEESEQESAVAPGPTQGVPQLEIYNIDLDGAHPSLFATQPGQIYHPASGPQKYSLDSRLRMTLFADCSKFQTYTLSYRWLPGDHSTRPQIGLLALLRE